MDFRNAVYTADGRIDCEINHPVHGWIPFTADPNDTEPLGAQVFDAAQGEAAPYVPPPDPDPAEALAAQIATFRRAVREHVDATAQSRDYDNGNSLASYTSSTVPAWKSEADAFIAWRDSVWTFVIELLAQVEAGEAPPPSSAAELIASLPDIHWP